MTPEALKLLVDKKESVEAMLAEIDTRLLVFGLVVLLGIAGETWLGVTSWLNNRRLRTIQRQIDIEKDRQAAMEAEQLKSVAAAAGESASKANERAEGLEQENVKTKLELSKSNIELEKIKEKQSPRALTNKQISDFIAFTKDLPKGTVSLQPEVDGEARNFRDVLTNLLKEAGYNITSSGASGVTFPNISESLIVVFEPDHKPAHADSLVSALNSIGVKAAYETAQMFGISRWAGLKSGDELVLILVPKK
ncbi:MAG: hypothetical protein ABJF10_22185 [Chthoniobacter sp.]|uniref:hypothetical protein n=1 Tax=Chthoniobacter sp. TaxID=2510640 RepID=UPI0032A91237